VQRVKRYLAAAGLPCLFGLTLGACGGGSDSPSSTPPPPPTIAGDITIKTLSNRADMISDGDAYVEVVLPSGATASDLKMDVDGTDVTPTFALRANGRVLGVLTGLPVGTSTFTATLQSVNKGAHLQITNTDRGGPIFSGPQIQPWICATPAGSPVTVEVPGTSLSATVTTRTSGLAAAPDAKCNAAPVFTYYYQPVALQGSSCTLGITGANPCFIQYVPTARPTDAQIANFTNDRGDTVKSLLRLELGTADRGEYSVLTYFDPAQPWMPWAPQKGWNGKLHWKFGASASGNRFQESPGTSVFDVNGLANGFMMVNAQLTNHNDNNNEFLAAEQAMMVKEHIIDTYGEIRYTMSDGLSGGSMMQTVISSVMPGLLQGIQPAWSYPDAVSTWIETRECGLYGKFYLTPAGATITTAQRAALEGKDNAYCNAWIGSFINPQVPTLPGNCGSGFPAAIVYDPVLRPVGVRCSIHDMMVNIFGTVIDTDRNVKPKLPYDNAGVQYGLQALRSGAITPEQFVEVNETIGAYDTDMNWTGGIPATPTVPAPRFRALPEVFPQIYQSALLDNAKNLAKVAMIDLRPEFGPNIHQPWRSSQKRARLDAANGGHANSVIRATLGAPGAAMTAQAFHMMDRWLTAIEADTSSNTIEQKVIADKPVDVIDGCYATPGNTTADLATQLTLTDPACPVALTLLQSTPRQVADGPRSEDIFKCQLKALDTTSVDYGGAVFSAAQVTRLKAVFTDGVCDWTKPGVGQTSQWVPTSFMNGPGGTTIPAAPTSTTF
jgi:Tannase-like family of unknown function (DUF6351)